MYRPRARDGGPPPAGEISYDPFHTTQDTYGIVRAFIPVYSFRRTTLNFKSAVLRYGQSLKEFRATREYSTLKSRVPEKTLSKFPNLISFDPSNYHFSLVNKFEKAVAAAEKAADDYHRANAPHAVHG